MESLATVPRRVPVRRLLALMAALLLVAGSAPALAEEGGSYTLQCFCPVEWSEAWDGQGAFNEVDSLDTVALANGDAVLILHEIPLDTGTIAGMLEDRTAVLEGSRAVDDLDEQVIDAGQEDWVLMGRSWANADGETTYGVQYVQVWEVSFLLSIEFVAPEDEFVESWETLDEVLLIDSPILAEFDGEDIADALA